jgi:hypothetical protein
MKRRSFFKAVAAAAAAVCVPGTVPVKAAVASSGAISIPFGTIPANKYIRGPRYKVMFHRTTRVMPANTYHTVFDDA